MERGKGTAKRGPKVKALPPPGDFIALGSKSTRPSPTEAVEPKLGSSKTSHSLQGTSSDRKREGTGVPSSPLSLAAKKPKLAPVAPISVANRPSISRKDKDGKKGDVWDTIAVDIDPSSFLMQIQDAEENGTDERLIGLICGAVKNLRSNRAKPEASLYLSLMFLAKTKQTLFCSDNVIEAFCSLLKRDMSLNFKAKGNALVSVLVANLLMAAYQEEKNWPDLFLTVYLEDALGERVWVDHEDCRGFVDNIQTAFNTKMPPKNMLQPEFGFKPEICPSPPPTISVDDDDTTESVTSSTDSKDKLDVAVTPRYAHIQEQAEQYVLEIVRDQVARRQPMDNISRNVLRLLTCASGLSEVRLMVSQRLEIWLQNPKLMRPAQELLLAVCLNCNQHNQQDVEVMGHLIKIRLKTKPLINHYLVCIRELLNQHAENLWILLKQTIYNELSNSRNPNNMTLLGVMFQHSPEQTAKILAEVFQDLLANRDDYLQALRALYREIVRSMRYDISFGSFCLGLMRERKEAQFKDLDPQLRERMFLSIADLVTLSIFMSITPNVREAASAMARGDRKDLSVLRSYQQLIATIQRDAVWWLQTVVPQMFKPARNDFIHCLHKVLFMEQTEHYYNKDNWPPEGDRPMMLRLASEIPVLEDTLMRLLIMGLSKEHPLNAPDAHELVDQLIKRAAALFTEDYQVIQVDRMDIIDALFNLCAYHYPENISLPSGYTPPNLAIGNLYWKAWIMLLIVTAHNPTTFGYEAWEKYPTLNSFIEMCITNHFTFPPPTMAVGDEADDIKSRELQIAHVEKQQILEFENHLASASTKVAITESNSLLLPQLTTIDPGGVARKPPVQILDQLKGLNQTLKLGHLLCRSRNPDFLLEIIQRQGTSQSMPWLADLVESSEGAFSVLPVQCLCEFLLNESPEIGNFHSTSSDREDGPSKEETKADRAKKKEKERKQKQLLKHLQSLLHESDDDSRPTSEVLDYFLRRLSSQQSSARIQAMKGLTMVLSPLKNEEDEESEMKVDVKDSTEQSWLSRYLPVLKHFETVRPTCSSALRQACQIETDPWVVSAYVHFLSNFAPDVQLQDLADLALNMAQLIVERTTILNFILPSETSSDDHKVGNLQALMIMFLKYLRKAREQQQRDAYSWSESQDQIIVQWSTDEVAMMHILVVHAMVILLTYGPPEVPTLFNELLEIWFPADTDPPQAFLVDTSEEALLLPDWLKLRMIRSNVEVLVDAALRDLDPGQLVLFIQSFGIPVATVSKLLTALDAAVEYAAYELETVVADKGYMLQLVEVQRQRGAIGGQRFVEMLDDGTVNQIENREENEMVFSPKREQPVIAPKNFPAITPETVPGRLTALFQKTTKFSEEQQDCFRSLHKILLAEAVSKKKPVTMVTLTTLDRMVSSQMAAEVVASMHSLPSQSCPLFRMLKLSLGKDGDSGEKFKLQLLRTSEKMLHYSADPRSPLTAVLKQICRWKSSVTKTSKEAVPMEEGIPTKFTEEYIFKIIHEAASQSHGHLEKTVNQILLTGMKQGVSQELVAALTKLLLDPITEKKQSASLFLDWLELLEPEVVSRIPDMQQQLLFAKKRRWDNVESTEPSFRPYLLSLLMHQTNWETLHKCLARILQPLHVDSYDSTSVLDFVWACVYIPKLWQGRDKHVPKHYEEENLLGLSEPQVCCLIEYVLEEAMSLGSQFGDKGKSDSQMEVDEEIKNNKSSSKLLTCSKEVIKLLEKRLKLLLHCCNSRNEILSAVVKYLWSVVDKKGPKSTIAHSVLLQMYLQVPRIIGWIEDVDKFLVGCQSTLDSSSKMDVISQALLTALASTEAGKDWNDKIQDIDLACRKMAACHPILMLRQLTMLSALLRGRTQLEFHVFKCRNHLHCFNCVLGVLELLQPHLFLKEYNSALTDTFESYFDLIKNHGLQNKELGIVINRFLTLLHNFISSDSQRAVRYIQKHSSILHDLSTIHPDMQSLRLLLAGISLPCQDSEDTKKEFVPTLLSFTPTQASPARMQVQMVPLLNRLSKGTSPEEILNVLQEIDVISNRKTDILEYFVDDLKKLMVDRSESCRNVAHSLVIRYMRQKPRSSREFLDAFLSCLDSDHQDIIMSALERLAEFSILSQENVSILLEKAYVVGISTSVNTLPYITETMMLLNMQSGS